MEEESGKDRKKENGVQKMENTKHFQAALTAVPWASILMAVPFGATTQPSVG